MMPSSKATVSTLEARLGFLLFLAADFMVFAGLLGAGIVLREGVSAWVTPPFKEALRSGVPWSAAVLASLALGLVPWKRGGVSSICLAAAFVGMVLEVILVVQKGISGSYAALFLFTSVFVLLHLGGALVWQVGSRFSPGPLFRSFLIFTATTGSIAILLLHWPLYS